MELVELNNVDSSDLRNYRNKQNEKCSESVKKSLTEYCDKTGIHGIRYLGENRTLPEKIFWLIILLLAAAGCFYMIYEILEKYLTRPVLVTFGVREVPIFEIPFPAITICPISKIPKSFFDYYNVVTKNRNGDKLTEIEKEQLSYTEFLCESIAPLEPTVEFAPISEEKFYKFLKDANNHLFLEKTCTFRGKLQDCDKILHKTLTDEGICFTFNILNGDEIFREKTLPFTDFYNVENSSEWSIDDGYNHQAGIETYPQRALFYGANDGFQITLLHNKTDAEKSCPIGTNGYLVHLHNPSEIPRLERNSFILPSDQVVTVAVTPDLLTTSDEVKRYQPEQRECYFQDEKKLKFFRIYNQANCNLECLTIYTYERCGCVEFFMPRHSNFPLCQPEQAECISYAEGKLKCTRPYYCFRADSTIVLFHPMFQQKFSFGIPNKRISVRIRDGIRRLQKSALHVNNFAENLKFDENVFKNYSCDCKPLCSQLNYNIQLSQSKYQWLHFFQHNQSIIKNFNDMSMSHLTIYFKYEQFLKQERNELYGIFDLISNFGGLLGLFTGWTLISIPELAYFLSLRWICNQRIPEEHFL